MKERDGGNGQAIGRDNGGMRWWHVTEAYTRPVRLISVRKAEPLALKLSGTHLARVGTPGRPPTLSHSARGQNATAKPYRCGKPKAHMLWISLCSLNIPGKAP